jgi:imidazolonepropionase-like amidohydrolase
MIHACITRRTAALLFVVLAVGSSMLSAAPLVIRATTLHTMAGESIENGVVVVDDGKIVAVGSSSDVTIPQGAQVLEAAVVTPGLIDAHSVVGLSGFLNQDQDQDQLERSAPLQPELRAIDGYNARDVLVAWVRSFGITTIHTGHAPGAVISGQTMIVKTAGQNVEDSVIVPQAMLAATLGEAATDSDPKRKGPGTRSKAVAMLRAELIRAGEYRTKRARTDLSKRPQRDLRLEALGQVLTGEIPLMVTVQRSYDILAAIRVAEEFDFRLVLDGVAEIGLVLDRVRDSGASILLHPTMQRASGSRENLSMETAAVLAREGVRFALQSSFETYVPKTRVVLFEAAVAAGFGLPFDRALASITIDAATILGIEDRVGSIEVGKDADLAMYDGDPFEYTTHCLGVVIDGNPIEQEPR